MDEDFLLALQLQEQFDYEASTYSSNVDKSVDQVSKKRKVGTDDSVMPYYSHSFEPEKPMSIVDESWEMLDPSPDVRAMFMQFNDMFFWGKLCGVEVKWSPRMTLCAGVCSYEGRGGLCSIRLSEPLLKLRPRRDLVQTLLHEMIHALLFVTQNNRDRDGHGPEFCKHMDRINKASGANITVYHTFHDEVDLYRQHWWRCDGPCQSRKPFFGYVKRAMNRAPSAKDPWWADHQRTCGGTYHKIKEPDDYGKKGKKGEGKDDKGLTKPTGKSKPSSTVTGKSGSQDIRNVLPFSGRGFVLGGNSQLSSSQNPPTSSHPRPNVPASPKPLSSPTGVNSPGWPGQSSLHKTASTATVSPGLGGPRPLGKKSISNTRAFININGSPVRISKDGGHPANSFSNSTDFARAKQRSVHDLFNAKGLKSPDRVGTSASASSASKAAAEIRGSLNDTQSGRPLVEGSCSKAFRQPAGSGDTLKLGHPNSLHAGNPGSSKPGFASSFDSKYPKSPAKPITATAVSRKRPWDDRTSASIFDFFQRKLNETSSPRGKTEGTGAIAPTPTVQTAPVSTASLTVSCPVCQSTVLESKINEHLDSCLT
ncbi:sprT-like domain-containing protein Spartan [Megalops cyprinoides]|uniref:sprT-like domain-containing protein Spartan n=1 Tax=Megalops cyprinoides TaxID=118141 RepID=UPI0018641B8E|nr:sprT-like domain-containing protein Spartan [Megalops cyprinoides]